jgi:hypothetical protein
MACGLPLAQSHTLGRGPCPRSAVTMYLLPPPETCSVPPMFCYLGPAEWQIGWFAKGICNQPAHGLWRLELKCRRYGLHEPTR